ncbi:MAG: outer membrane protein [Terriglobia bacterium]
MRRKLLIASFFGTLLLAAPFAAKAQDESLVHEISVQGTGFFTKDSDGNGITQHSTDTGGFLAGYRIHLTRWLAADGTYGYIRNTQQNFTAGGPFAVQSNVSQVMGALVANLPSTARFEPYVLAGAGALIFDPTGNEGGFVPGAETQTKAAFVYGGGANYHIFPHVSLRLEYRGLAYKRPDFGLSFLNSNTLTHTAQPSAGIVFRF